MNSSLRDAADVVDIVGRGVATVHSEPDAARAAVVIVGGHEGGAEVPVEPLVEQGPLLRASSAGHLLENAVQQALDGTDLPVCVVPMTLGRDPQLVADTARTLTWLTRGPMAGRVMLAEPFGNATLLTGWLRVAVARVVDPFDAPDVAVLLTAKAANPFDDAELFRIAHLVKSRGDLPWVEVALRGGEPDVAEGVERCGQLGARQVVVVPADFGPAVEAPTAGAVDGGPLLMPSEVSGMLATRISAALLKLSRGDDGIAAGLDADHQHGHGGTPWREADYGTD
ncbi:sirohydrochlorin chelatase [Catenulispora sp. EB89]|uniref:sirohydrochlorin chelatase n=1 Tax=Catenulispora sp. EB89 TaxID=3156257 RepID=UPI003514F707